MYDEFLGRDDTPRDRHKKFLDSHKKFCDKLSDKPYMKDEHDESDAAAIGLFFYMFFMCLASSLKVSEPEDKKTYSMKLGHQFNTKREWYHFVRGCEYHAWRLYGNDGQAYYERYYLGDGRVATNRDGESLNRVCDWVTDNDLEPKLPITIHVPHRSHLDDSNILKALKDESIIAKAFTGERYTSDSDCYVSFSVDSAKHKCNIFEFVDYFRDAKEVDFDFLRDYCLGLQGTDDKWRWFALCSDRLLELLTSKEQQTV